MDSRFKKIFLMCTVIVPFVGYCVYYYAHVFKNAPYRFSEFEYMTIQYGPGDSLINKYNSSTGEYQFGDNRDSLVKINLHLPKEELLYLHRKAAELGFWAFPVVEMGDTTQRRNGMRPLRYIIEFVYKNKTKKVMYDESYYMDQRLKDANEQFIAEIKKVLEGEEEKQKK